MVFGLALLATCPLFAQIPSANFTASPLSGCSPLIVNFRDQSTGGPTSWSWDLGNGNISTQQNPSATYFTPGTYTVKLTATNASGSNTLTRTQLITVYALPTVNFSANIQAGCFPLHVQFTDLSTAPSGSSIISWQWDFGNGVTSNLQHPQAVYTTAGNYAVTLKVTDDKGCSRILGRSGYIVATPGVVSSFSTTPAVACLAPATIQFNNTSTGPGTLSYEWDFGDGNTSLLPSPTHIFNTTGSFAVRLVTRSNSGCEDTVINTVPVGGFASSFQHAPSTCPGTPVIFTNTSTPQPDSVRWFFGDGTISSAATPSHSFSNPGVYTVSLHNYFGTCIDSAKQQITVTSPPVANFNAGSTTSCRSSLTVNFTDLSSNAASWQWNFGDSTFSSQQNPSHTYSNYGDYTVTLIVTNTDGCSDTLSMPAYIRLQQPVITIPQLPANGCIPFTINPVPVISAVDAITSYTWNFGDGTTSTLQNPAHTYTIQGSYRVSLVYTTSTGCTDSVVFNPGVRAGTKPTADFSASPLQACASQAIQFNNLSSQADEMLWSFGDSGTSGGVSPAHTYTDTGYFNIQLIATNSGCPDTMTKANYIRILPPVSRFDIVPECSNRLMMSFTDLSVLPQTWLWDFGDGSTSTQQNPSHIYAAIGSYTVTLTVTNGGCSHSSTRTINLTAPAPGFTADATTICKGLPVTFTPSGFDPAQILNVVWVFGDGTQGNTPGLQSISHAYPVSGVYTVSMVTVDVNFCRDTTTKTAYIRVNGPTAAFTNTSSGNCVNAPVNFADQSLSDGTNALVSWLWNFGDGTVQLFTGPPFVHAYTTADTFSVSLLVTDAAGCRDSITQADQIRTSAPQLSFHASQLTTCPGGILSFSNTTAPPPVSSFWDFGDGTTSNAPSPVHIYADTGIFTIKMVITDSSGCTDSLVKTDHIRVVLPRASFVVNDSFSACTPLEVQFTSTSDNAVLFLWDFGPGEGTSTLADPVHFFATPGIYPVKLIVTSDGGCLDSAFINITVLDTAGLQFNYSPLDGCNPFTVNFSAVGPLSTQSYFWDFGDGTMLTNTPSVTHVYQSFGNFLPKLVLLDPPACVFPVSGIDTVRVRGSNVGFSLSDSLICDAGSIQFTDTTSSSDPIISYSWNFGDGGTSTLQHPSHYFAGPGLYDVSLTVTTQTNCVNTFTKTAAVMVVARPDISIAGNNVCIYDSTVYRGIFNQPDTSAVTWSWTFPNGNSPKVQFPPPQSFSSAGDFVVYAYATNSSGCIDTASLPVTVHPLPTVDLPGQMTILSGSSDTIPASYNGGVIQWSWTPPIALSCVDCPRPIAGPRATTTYQVAFSDTNGCRNTGRIDVVVVCKDVNFYIPNTFSPNGDGSNDRFYPRGRGLYLIRSLRIFNRWGEAVFERRDFAANDASSGWDGKFKGNNAQPDVYVYQIEIQCDNGELIKLSGNIALIL